jgi:hypothetical protein
MNLSAACEQDNNDGEDGGCGCLGEPQLHLSGEEMFKHEEPH